MRLRDLAAVFLVWIDCVVLTIGHGVEFSAGCPDCSWLKEKSMYSGWKSLLVPARTSKLIRSASIMAALSAAIANKSLQRFEVAEPS